MGYQGLGYLYVLLTVLFTVYGQLILKHRILHFMDYMGEINISLLFILRALVDPYILSGFFAAFLAALCWMAAMTRFELSHAYPFMAINFVLVLVLSGLFFGESITFLKILGISLVVVGIIVGSQG